MLTINKLCCLSVLAVLSACGINDTKDEDSTFYAVPVGSSLTLNRTITIPGDQVAIYLQNGEILRYKDVNKYAPNCKFEVYKISERPRTVQADTFKIIKVEDDIESSSLQNGMQYAAFGGRAGEGNASVGLLDQSEMFNYATFMYLSSATQKDVYRMICQHWESVMDDRHLSISQMRTAMGEVFTLKIKDY
jgi:hypothetical protein